MLKNNLYKPAPTQRRTQINLMFERIQKMYGAGLPPKLGRVYYIIGFRHKWLVKPAPTDLANN